MISFSITGDDALLDSLRAKEGELIERLRKQVDVSDLMIQKSIQQKVTGEMLQVRTGKLSRSVVTIPAKVNANSIDGYVEGGGGPAFYLKYQNDGTNGPYAIVSRPSKKLASILDGNMMRRMRLQGRMHPGLPALHFMEKGLADSEADIVEGLQNAVGDVLAG